MTEKTFLTVKEAAAYIGTTPNYLYKLMSQKHRIPYYAPTGRKCLFKRTELDAWIEQSRVASGDEIAAKVERITP